MSAPFRIQKRSAITTQADEPQADFKSYMARLVQLIPAEVIGVYLTLRSFGDSTNPEHAGYFFWISLIGLILVLVSRIWGTSDVGLTNVQVPTVIISSISYLIWLYAIGDTFIGVEITDTKVISAAVVIWTFVVPVFYKGD